MDRIADRFVNYLFDQYRGSRHVRRVAAWLGLVLTAIRRAGGENVQFHRTRQLTFDYDGRRFKARYNHQVGARGGIELVEILPGRGAPDGRVLLQIADLDEAEEAYRGALRRALTREGP